MGFDTGHAARAPAAGPAEPRTFEPKDGLPDVKPMSSPNLNPSSERAKGRPSRPKLLTSPRARTPKSSTSPRSSPGKGEDIEMGEVDGDEVRRATCEIDTGASRSRLQGPCYPTPRELYPMTTSSPQGPATAKTITLATTLEVSRISKKTASAMRISSGTPRTGCPTRLLLVLLPMSLPRRPHPLRSSP